MPAEPKAFPVMGEDILNGNERDILIILVTRFQLFAENQERTNQSHNERLLELLHKQDQKADKFDLEKLSSSDKEIMNKVDSLAGRVEKLENRNEIVDSEARGKQRAFQQIQGLGGKAWAFIFGIISFGIMIIEFLKK